MWNPWIQRGNCIHTHTHTHTHTHREREWEREICSWQAGGPGEQIVIIYILYNKEIYYKELVIGSVSLVIPD